jgi:hypothetical protein
LAAAAMLLHLPHETVRTVAPLIALIARCAKQWELNVVLLPLKWFYMFLGSFTVVRAFFECDSASFKGPLSLLFEFVLSVMLC